jgi:ATP-dependent DNA helicase PIF1
MSLSPEQETIVAFALEHAGAHVLVHGPAGAGKSRVLQTLLNVLPHVVCLGPTGMSIAAFDQQRVQTIDRYLLGPTNGRCQSLIIDEISMLDAARFCRLDAKLKRANGSLAPFGGARLVLFGDMYQLESIAFPFFTTDLWKFIEQKNPPVVFQLLHIHRLDDPDEEAREEWLHFLTALRYNALDARASGLLDGFLVPRKHPTDCLVLCAKRDQAQQINAAAVQAFEGEPIVLGAGEPLKLGIRVLIEHNIYNNKQLVACNGQLGVLQALEPLAGESKKSKNGAFVVSPKYQWHAKVLCDKTSTVIDVYSMPLPENKNVHVLPLGPAYAVTMHKIQGQTLDAAIIDGTDLFGSVAQLYTAFSRVKTLHGVYVRNLHSQLLQLRERPVNVQKFIEKYALK